MGQRYFESTILFVLITCTFLHVPLHDCITLCYHPFHATCRNNILHCFSFHAWFSYNILSFLLKQLHLIVLREFSFGKLSPLAVKPRNCLQLHDSSYYYYFYFSAAFFSFAIWLLHHLITWHELITVTYFRWPWPTFQGHTSLLRQIPQHYFFHFRKNYRSHIEMIKNVFMNCILTSFQVKIFRINHVEHSGFRNFLPESLDTVLQKPEQPVP